MTNIHTQENSRFDQQTGRKIETLDHLRKSQWNVVGREAFQKRAEMVLEAMAQAVSRTLGPGGSTTIIEQAGAPHITKDGWSVIRQFKFADQIDRNLYDMYSRTSGAVVSSSGDGTTTALVAANSIRHHVANYIKEQEAKGIKIRPNKLMKKISKVIDIIIDELHKITTTIDLDTEEGLNHIRNIALISTNSDEELSEAIVEIYRNTKNPVISVEKSLGRETTHQIIDGYRSAMGYVDGQYALGSSEDWVVKVEDPRVLLFDHQVSQEKHNDFIQFAFDDALSRLHATGEEQVLIIAAPFYDQATMNLAKEWLYQYQQKGLKVRVIFTRVNIVQKVDKAMLEDLAALLGVRVLNDRICSEYSYYEFKQADNPGEDFKKVYPHRDPENPFNITEYLGRCGEALIGNEGTLFRDLLHKDEALVEVRKTDAEHQFHKYENKAQKLGAIELERQEAIIRLSSLSCSMGSISVGAESSLHQEQLVDALDDAIKACESAYRYGFVMGGSFAIPYAIQRFLEDNLNFRKLDDEEIAALEAKGEEGIAAGEPMYFTKDPNVETTSEIVTTDGKGVTLKYDRTLTPEFMKGEGTFDVTMNVDEETMELLMVFRDAFLVLFQTIADNAQLDDLDINEVFKNVLLTGKCYNIETEEYDSLVVNPVQTDIQVLKSAVSIVTLILTSNQYLTQLPEFVIQSTLGEV